MSFDRSNEHWDFYFSEIDGAPHSTMVNPSLWDVAPIAALCEFYCIEIKLKYPKPENGMTMVGVCVQHALSIKRHSYHSEFGCER